MPLTASEQDDRNEIDELCRYLFDDWCERRSVVPLSYLMHAWPLVGADPRGCSRLLEALQELLESDPESLTRSELLIIRQMLAIHAHKSPGIGRLRTEGAIKLGAG
jgi:hypothetical protein